MMLELSCHFIVLCAIREVNSGFFDQCRINSDIYRTTYLLLKVALVHKSVYHTISRVRFLNLSERDRR